MNVRVIKPAPVRKTLRVNASVERAFDVFARETSRWWPARHAILKAALKDVIVEPFAGGRWYQTGVDGSECDMGRVLAWEPPGRLVLGWQIGSEWKYDAGLLTEVEINFIPEGERLTRVEFEHRLLERYGDEAEKMRGLIDSAMGWSEILESYRKTASEGKP